MPLLLPPRCQVNNMQLIRAYIIAKLTTGLAHHRSGIPDKESIQLWRAQPPELLRLQLWH